MDELDIPPSKDDLIKAIDSFACSKAPGSDGIPPEVVKSGKHSALPDHLYELLLQGWEEGNVPQDVRDANIVTLYKTKGREAIATTTEGCFFSAYHRWENICPRFLEQTANPC